MTFSEFANRLHPIIGGSSSQPGFAKTLFETITLEGGQEILQGKSRETYKAYFNGQTQIGKIATALGPYVDPEEFVGYLDQFPDAVIESLVEAFEQDIPGINSVNACLEIATLFAKIIREAAGTKRKAPRKQDEPKASTAHEKLSAKIFASGAAMADVWGKAMERLAEQLDDETVEAEVVDDEPSSGAAEADAASNVQIIKNATIVNQYGEKCVHIDHVENFKL